ncbi:MAG: type II toxin-antitoxin system PemK/MazF family toxin [Candidatus ainarchaeum sp.]|nr:type II toxin-antitoxin system PemK/MazF family toxin [Candidatus ainarchaeum sp.]
MGKNNEKEYLQKEIILFPCPYSDFSGNKIRPGIILSNNSYNQNNQDILIAPITTKYKNNYSLKITKENLINGRIAHDSEIRTDKIMPINKSIIITQIAITTDEILILIINKLLNLIQN